MTVATEPVVATEGPLTLDQFVEQAVALEKRYRRLLRAYTRACGDVAGIKSHAKLLLTVLDNAEQQLVLQDGKIRHP